VIFRQAAMEPIVEPSYLHKRFAIPLGEAPSHFYKPDRCDGDSSQSLFEEISVGFFLLAFVAGFLGFVHSRWWFIGLLSLVPSMILTRLTDRFLSRERLARARRRREIDREQVAD
jgi:hypothetical protein